MPQAVLACLRLAQLGDIVCTYASSPHIDNRCTPRASPGRKRPGPKQVGCMCVHLHHHRSTTAARPEPAQEGKDSGQSEWGACACTCITTGQQPLHGQSQREKKKTRAKASGVHVCAPASPQADNRCTARASARRNGSSKHTRQRRAVTATREPAHHADTSDACTRSYMHTCTHAYTHTRHMCTHAHTTYMHTP